MKKEMNVVGAILIKDHKIFCCQRGPGRALPSLWEFPGGKIEKGETPIEALHRELREELHLEDVVIHPEVFEECCYEYDFGTVHLTTFLCKLQLEEPVLTEHIAYQWLEPRELLQLDWTPADVWTVKKLISRDNSFTTNK